MDTVLKAKPRAADDAHGSVDNCTVGFTAAAAAVTGATTACSMSTSSSISTASPPSPLSPPPTLPTAPLDHSDVFHALRLLLPPEILMFASGRCSNADWVTCATGLGKCYIPRDKGVATSFVTHCWPESLTFQWVQDEAYSAAVTLQLVGPRDPRALCKGYLDLEDVLSSHGVSDVVVRVCLALSTGKGAGRALVFRVFEALQCICPSLRHMIISAPEQSDGVERLYLEHWGFKVLDPDTHLLIWTTPLPTPMLVSTPVFCLIPRPYYGCTFVARTRGAADAIHEQVNVRLRAGGNAVGVVPASAALPCLVQHTQGTKSVLHKRKRSL